ncbi:MAG TPA: hypothetical protein VEP90_26810, partial [Methylomirabilota bacterium]|nr:hypothetical protein [Methylomirabilota bacterium]
MGQLKPFDISTNLPNLDELTHNLKSLEAILICLARLTGLAVLGEARLSTKLEFAYQSVSFLEKAIDLDDFLTRYYQIRSNNVAWPIAANPEKIDILVDGQLKIDILRQKINFLALASSQIIADVTKFV